MSAWDERVAELTAMGDQWQRERREAARRVDESWQPRVEAMRARLAEVEPDHDRVDEWSTEDVFHHLALHHRWESVWLVGRTRDELTRMHARCHPEDGS